MTGLVIDCGRHLAFMEAVVEAERRTGAIQGHTIGQWIIPGSVERLTTEQLLRKAGVAATSPLPLPPQMLPGGGEEGWRFLMEVGR